MKRKKKIVSAVDFIDITSKQLVLSRAKIINDQYTKMEDGTTMSVNRLPDCRHRSMLMMIIKNKDAKIAVIAFLYPDGHWDVTAGYPDVRDLRDDISDPSILWNCENIRDREQVLMMGEVLDKDTAVILFPDFAKAESYKRHV